jgi:hypothetical protein
MPFPNRFDGVEGFCPRHRQGRRGWDHRGLCRRRCRFSLSTIGPTCRSAGLSFDDWASNTRLHQSRNHGGTRLIGSRRLLRSKSVLCRFTRSRVLSEGDKRDSQSHMPGGTRLNLKPEPHVPHRGRSYFAPEPASRTRPRRIHSRSAGCEEMLLVGNCREL